MKVMKAYIKSFTTDKKYAESIMDFGKLTAESFKTFVLKNQRVAESLEVDYMDKQFSKNDDFPLNKIYMDAYISHLSRSDHVNANTEFELADFVSTTAKLSKGASPFHKVDWKSIQGKLHADELKRLFKGEKYAMLHSSSFPKVQKIEDTISPEQKIEAIESSQALMKALIHQLK